MKVGFFLALHFRNELLTVKKIVNNYKSIAGFT